MDFAEAAERLAKPISKDSKILGHKLTLRRLTENGKDWTNAYALEYFKTDILVWHPDGGVVIKDGGFLSSNYTITKVNEYLPKDWRLTTVPVKFERNKFVGVLYKGSYDDNWERKTSWAYPYASGSRFYEGGRADLHSVHQHSAFDLIQKTKSYVELAVDAFMSGQFSHADLNIEAMDKILEAKEQDSPEREDLMLGLLELGTVSASTMLGVILSAFASIPTRHIAWAYWAEYFPLTGSGKNKSIKQRVLELELKMKNDGDYPRRYLGNSKGHHSLKQTLRASMEQFILEGLGFTVYERESFGHLRNGF